MKNEKKKFIKINTTKLLMSQKFDESANIIPFTSLKLKNKDDIKIFESFEINKKITLIGKSKGRGFTGTVKRWNFRSGPNTHGQIKGRATGSIGAQGYGRVLPGKKMPGRYGGEKISYETKYLGLNKDDGTIMVKGGVPGSYKSPVIINILEKSQ